MQEEPGRHTKDYSPVHLDREWHEAGMESSEFAFLKIRACLAGRVSASQCNDFRSVPKIAKTPF